MIFGHYVDNPVNTITSYSIVQRLFSALDVFRPQWAIIRLCTKHKSA